MPLPGVDESGLGDFAGAILDAMQEWRDNVQTSLPGYRERVATVVLDDREGGLNLNMPAWRVENLAEYGAQAGALLNDQFDFFAHRWRRHLVWLAQVERMMLLGRERYGTIPATERLPEFEQAVDGVGLREFLTRYGPVATEYRQTQQRLRYAVENFDGLMRAAQLWESIIPRDPHGAITDIPHPLARIQVVPSEDLPPRPVVPGS